MGKCEYCYSFTFIYYPCPPDCDIDGYCSLEHRERDKNLHEDCLYNKKVGKVVKVEDLFEKNNPFFKVRFKSNDDDVFENCVLCGE